MWGMNMEPGSTFKLVTLMALLDDAKAGINEVFDTESGVAYMTPYKVKVTDSHKGGFGKISLKRIFEVSSNIGFAKAINKYYGADPERFTDYLYKLGLADKYDLQVPGETAPHDTPSRRQTMERLHTHHDVVRLCASYDPP